MGQGKPAMSLKNVFPANSNTIQSTLVECLLLLNVVYLFIFNSFWIDKAKWLRTVHRQNCDMKWHTFCLHKRFSSDGHVLEEFMSVHFLLYLHMHVYPHIFDYGKKNWHHKFLGGKRYIYKCTYSSHFIQF